VSRASDFPTGGTIVGATGASTSDSRLVLEVTPG